MEGRHGRQGRIFPNSLSPIHSYTVYMYTETMPNNSLYLVIQNRGFKFLITDTELHS